MFHVAQLWADVRLCPSEIEQTERNPLRVNVFGLPLIPEIARCSRDFAIVPQADLCTAANSV